MNEKKDFYWLNDDSRQFLNGGYLKEGETPEQRIDIIAKTAERILGIDGFAKKITEYIAKGWISLASPVWSNFGNDKGLGCSCNGQLISDTMQGILSNAAETGIMTKNGSGTSAFFGNLRPRGASISIGGKSSGPVHFMEIFDTISNVVSQSNVRRGSFAAYLSIEHPDVLEFLQIREEGNKIQNTSIGLTITDTWMQSMIDGDKEKRKVWAAVIKKRFHSGYPYLYFYDSVNNKKHKAYKDKDITIWAGNLCVTADQMVPTDRGMLSVQELYEYGQPLNLFDNQEIVPASEMKLIEKDADVFKITLKNGMTHKITSYHKVLTNNGMVACSDLKLGDKVAFQNKKGIFNKSDFSENEILNIQEDFVPKWLWKSSEDSQINYLEKAGVIHESSNVFYLSKNLKYLQNLQLLLANLGIITSISFEKIEYMLESHGGKPYSEIVSIEKLDKENVYCCTVDSEEHTWVCNGIVTSNCSETAIPAGEDFSFACILSSLNVLHFDEWKNTDLVKTLTYFLDAVTTEYIEKCEKIPFMEKAAKFAREHRAIGIGVLGWHSYLQSKMIPFESMEAKYKNCEIFEHIDKESLVASKKLAEKYGEPEMLKGYGERMTTRMAVAPTTSSSFILGQISPSIEPLNSNYFVKKLAKGNFTYKNPYLKSLLKEKNKDDSDTWKSILTKGGSVAHLDFLSEKEKDVFKTFSEISQKEVVIQAAMRQKYIDQSQSLNLMIHSKTPAKDVSQLLIEGWQMGIKSFYYQRSTSPSLELSRSIMTCKSCEA